MKNKLEKQPKNDLENQATAAEIPYEEAMQILLNVNVTNPSKEDKEAFYRLLRQKPNIFKLSGGIYERNLEAIMKNQDFTFYRTEQMKHELSEMREAFGFQTASELEKLLIEQICLNWLRLNLLENVHNCRTIAKHDTESGLYWEKRLDTAHKRYMRTLETLAKVRRHLAEADFRQSQAEANRIKAAKVAGQAFD